MEDTFGDLADEFIATTEHVECPFEAFIAGLKVIELAFKSRREAAEAELRARSTE